MRQVWAIIAGVALLLAGCSGASHPVYDVQLQGQGYCQSGDVMVWSDRLGQGLCTPRLCQEDEVLDWVADDVRGCVHSEE